MTSDSQVLSQTDKEIFSGPVYMAAMFDRVNKFIKRSEVIFIARKLIDEQWTTNSFKLKLSRLITSLSDAEQIPSVQIEPFVQALIYSKSGQPVAHTVGDLRWVLWHACYLVKCLAYNDGYKVELIKLDVVDVCMEILLSDFSGEDLYLIPNGQNKIQAFGILEHLSFCPDFRPLAKSDKFQVCLENFKDDNRFRPFIERIRWNLTFDSREIKKIERYSNGHILLCFTNADDEVRRRVLHLVEEKSNFKGVLNEFQDIPSMMEGIDNASVILLGLSPNLAKSAKERIEVKYAQARGKPIMALNIASPHYPNRMTGWLSQFARCFDMTNRNEFPRTVESLLNGFSKVMQGAADGAQFRMSGSEFSLPGYTINPVSQQHSPVLAHQNPEHGNLSSTEEIYRWLKHIVHLENQYIDRFRHSHMTTQSFIHLRHLATTSFSDFKDLLSQPDFQFPIGVVLHLAHFLMREFVLNPPDLRERIEEEKKRAFSFTASVTACQASLEI